jgi:hypothetical protein
VQNIRNNTLYGFKYLFIEGNLFLKSDNPFEHAAFSGCDIPKGLQAS